MAKELKSYKNVEENGYVQFEGDKWQVLTIREMEKPFEPWLFIKNSKGSETKWIGYVHLVF